MMPKAGRHNRPPPTVLRKRRKNHRVAPATIKSCEQFDRQNKALIDTIFELLSHHEVKKTPIQREWIVASLMVLQPAKLTTIQNGVLASRPLTSLSHEDNPFRLAVESFAKQLVRHALDPEAIQEQRHPLRRLTRASHTPAWQAIARVFQCPE
ncbi:MAG: hypothetical protein EBZ69_06935 [Alphaproteobacteria bacterium]|nr:hypothetical protein [Alphaproteobacteria bacterium]NDG04798.1 hypothetical protein [Alphaproteobacteria bacterium]